jgi:hypothetical protein
LIAAQITLDTYSHVIPGLDVQAGGDGRPAHP